MLVEPNWKIKGDWEGRYYAEYIASHPEYNAVYARQSLATRLQKAAAELGTRYKLVIRAGHRSIQVQRNIYIACAKDYQNENPGVSYEDALKHARMFVSDPDLTLPPHVCGAAIDVDVFDVKSEQLLDFGSPLNDDTEKSFLHYSGLNDKQKGNRLMLLKAMLKAGFASCNTEWWHFSYGDQVWAWFYGKKHSLYNPVDI